MILPDINLLVYAYNSDAPDHQRAKAWWEAALSESRPVGLPWAVMLGFLRLMTSRSVLVAPLAPREALRHISSWLERPQVQILHLGPRHLELLDGLMEDSEASGSLTTDVLLGFVADQAPDHGVSHKARSRTVPSVRRTGMRPSRVGIGQLATV